MARGGATEAVNAYTRDQHRQVGSAPDPGRAHAWRSELSPREIELFENRTRDLLWALGYELLFDGAGRPATVAERVAFAVGEVVKGRGLNRLRKRKRRSRV